MKKSKIFLNIAFAIVLFTNIFTLTGCMKKSEYIPYAQSMQEDTKGQYVILEEQTTTDTAQTQDDAQEQGAETGSIMRAYSEQEKERMAKLQQSYKNETEYPESLILEVESADEVTEGRLCYIRSTGEYYLPDRELTDEELLEIIDCSFRIALNTNRKTQEEYDAEDMAELAQLRGKVQTAGGISEEEAIKIAKKALENDLGESGKDLRLHLFDKNGGDLELMDVSVYDEYKDKGEIAYFVQFDDLYKVQNFSDMRSYHCVINAIDGSILDAYEIYDWDEVEFYEH